VQKWEYDWNINPTGGYPMEKPTSDEKVLAALAHISVLLSLFGPLGPTLIWTSQRSKSKYVRFHALQAMGYQAIAFWVWMIGIFVMTFGIIFLSAGMMIILDRNEMLDEAIFPFLIQMIAMLVIFGTWGIYFLAGILGAVLCLMGRDFRYPVIGSWLRKKLCAESISETEVEQWEDGWVGGICHLTAIMHFWGIITPLVVWFTQKERSARLRLQALQAAIYQLVAVVAQMLGTAAYFVFFFMMMFSIMIFDGLSSSPDGKLPSVVGFIFFLFIVVFMLFWLAMMVATPVYFLLAAFAGIRTIRGHDFKYPILGHIIARRMKLPGRKVTTTP
jgi:uncharacterized Tic20 family protein